MGDRTEIQWADATWNPIRGCTRVSAGCQRCYAEHVAARFSGPGQPYEGLARFATHVNGVREARWTGEVRLVEDALAKPLHWHKPRRIFVNSTSDLFHEKVPDEWIDRILAIVALCPQHKFLVLTKRPERMRDYLSDPARAAVLRETIAFDARRLGAGAVAEAMGGVWEAEQFGDEGRVELAGYYDGLPELAWPLPNLWLGVSCEDQATADERIPLLLATPAAVRFVSAEPLLGPVDFATIDLPGGYEECAPLGLRWLGRLQAGAAEVERLDWVIAGGEFGPGARPCRVEWVRSIVEQCRAAAMPCFCKQLGRSAVMDRHDAVQPCALGAGWSALAPGSPLGVVRFRHPKGGDPLEWPADLRVREWPDA